MCSSSPLQRNISELERIWVKNDAFSFEEHIRNSQTARKTTEWNTTAIFQSMKDIERFFNCFKMQIGASIETTSLQFQNKCVTVVFSTTYNWGTRHLATELLNTESLHGSRK